MRATIVKFITWGCVLLTILLSISCCEEVTKKNAENNHKPPVEEITFGINSSDLDLLAIIANERNFYQKNGLSLKLRTYLTGDKSVEALKRGEIDIASSTDFVFVKNTFNDTDLKIISTVVTTSNLGEIFARKDAGIYAPQDLKGKSIAFPKNTAADYYLNKFLLLNSVYENQVSLVDMSPLKMQQAMENRTIDACLTFYPYLYELKEAIGNEVIRWDVQMNSDILGVLSAKEEYIKENQYAINKLLQSLLDAENFIESNKRETKEIIEEKFGYDNKLIDELLIGREYEIGLPRHLLISMEAQAQWMIDNDYVQSDKLPNHLDYIYFDAMEKVDPSSTTIIHNKKGQ
jgi:NitT/TauT family transport system substrate-binding protein